MLTHSTHHTFQIIIFQNKVNAQDKGMEYYFSF